MNNVYISEKANEITIQYLLNCGYKVNKVTAKSCVYKEINTHADIFMCKMGIKAEDKILHADISEIGYSYPQNIKYNAVFMGKYFIHNLKYSSPNLIKEAERKHCVSINVKQGYTKCNTVVVDEASAITSDISIYSALKKHNLDVLLISEGHVVLEGFEYGFLGGTSGRIGNEIIFHGNLAAHPDFKIISDFIISKGLGIKYFKQFPLTDIGSIFEELK